MTEPVKTPRIPDDLSTGGRDYFINIYPTPTKQYPLSARVRTPTGGIRFYTPEEATEWLDTPHRHMAETYIKWTKEKQQWTNE